VFFDIHTSRRSFYAAFNNIHSHAKTLEEPVQLALFESYCLPLLTFAAGAVAYNQQQVRALNSRWNTIYGTELYFLFLISIFGRASKVILMV